MRLLTSKPPRPTRTGVDTPPHFGGVGGEVEQPTNLSDEQLAATQAIGARYEGISASLEAATQVIEHIQSLQNVLQDIRQPISDEFNAHKNDHAELMSLRTAFAEAGERAAASHDRERGLGRRMGELEAALADARHAAQSNTALAEDAALETDRLRAVLAQVEGKSVQVVAAFGEASTRLKQLDQDNAGLRNQVHEADNRRREVDALLSRANQEGVLHEQELASLKARIERTIGETARLARAETELSTQLAAERARVLSLESGAALAQSDAAKLIQGLEEQLATSRWEFEAQGSRLETAVGQVSRLNDLNADLSRRLEDANAQLRVSERRATEYQTTLTRADERLRAMESEAAAQRSANLSIEGARATAVERAQQLGKQLQAQEIALRRSEEKEATLRAALEKLQVAHEEMQHAHEGEIGDLHRRIERQQADASIAEGALEAARRDRARLQLVLLGKAEPLGGAMGGAMGGPVEGHA